MQRKIICSNCGCLFKTEGAKCPQCGGEDYTVTLGLKDSVSFKESVKIKSKEQGKKKPVKESFYGVDYSKSARKYIIRKES